MILTVMETELLDSYPSMPKLDEDEKEKCEGRLTYNECYRSLLTFQTGKAPGNDGLQSIYVTCDRMILKFDARVQIYVAVLNIGCKIQNSGGNVVSFSKINSCEISF